jgi:prepilin-type N-terminal cleavage/methylation domain-containing protein
MKNINICRSESGYTLLELLLVIFILGSISSTFLIQPAQYNKYRLDKEIEELAADFRWARNKAVLDNKTYIFRIYTNSDSSREQNQNPYYFYVESEGKKLIMRRGSYPADLILYKNLELVELEVNYYEWIRFNSTATARGGTIGFAEPGGDIYSITVNQLGRVRIEK